MTDIQAEVTERKTMREEKLSSGSAQEIIENSSFVTKPKTPGLVITHLKDLDQLRYLPHTAKRMTIQIAMPTLNSSYREKLERRLEKNLSACGCNEGTIAGVLYIIAIPTLLFISKPLPASFGGWMMLFGGLIAALIIGKFFGLAIARIRFMRTLKEIKQLFITQAEKSYYV